ncbi:putative Dna-repair protein [Leptomonas seymouri]|uniref:Putative Dna-repair protein n=1 Tax=Leptomonas seymouri TaxID=5684 RepID=A0A0N0P4G5_LEPSE|nr:putative Dna-repair protein [Leptomonas seymouri]|eukprot:KPI85269.1 putative Dna-repair protein [Leptomonas seymouri]
MASNAPKGSKSVALVATASVDGYLRNASKRQRVPAAEGGRGTRRKLAMVTSASAHAPAEESEVPPLESFNSVDTDADEWDEVVLPQASTAIKKQEVSDGTTVVKMNVADDDSSGAVKAEAASGLPVVKAEGTTLSTISDTQERISCIKAELINVDENVPDDAPVMEGAQLPLVGQPRSLDTWRQRDPAYEAMMEQRDLLAAQRRSERIQRVCETLFEVLCILLRARLLWRQCSHPKFVKFLLRLHLPASPGEAKRTRTEKIQAKGNQQHVFLKAVLDSKALVAESTEPRFRKLSLAPAWVSCAKDTVQNKTSTAVKALLDVINKYFKLAAAPEVLAPTADASLSTPTTTLNVTTDQAAAASPRAEQDFSDWSVSIVPRYLLTKLAELQARVCEESPVELPHPLYFSVLFLALAKLAGLRCRLVVARQGLKRKEEKRASSSNDLGGKEAEVGEEGGADDGTERAGRRRPLQKLSIFEGRQQNKMKDRQGSTAGGSAAKGAKRKRSDDGDANNEELKSKKLPTSCFWVEVWSPEREVFLSVNPCKACATLWGAPYTFSVSGHVAVDATPRYTSKYSAAYAYGRRLGTCQQHRFLWHDKLSWDDSRELTEVIRASFNEDNAHTSALTQRQQQREKRQLHSLMYSEVVPTTLSALHRHPLYVIESDLARHEGIYPKDASTAVGSVKGHMVYKRSAIVSLRSRDGWLREGRSLLSEDQVPYKVVDPPASRPFASPSMFFGRWQTKPFEPLPLVPGDPPTIPHHGRTSWYILLDKPTPAGIVHLTQPQIARIARRMRLDFGLAVTGFERRRTDEHRRGHWETLISGIVVKESDSSMLLHAYEEWIQLVQEQEAAKRRHRAFHWWLLLSQRLLALKRLQDQYARGLGAGAMPMQ